jgi:DNA-binding transcriptional ArsR family regulator
VLVVKGTASPLSVLGFSAQEEHLYRAVLRNSGATVDVVAAHLGIPHPEVREPLARLEAIGLVEVNGDVLVAVSPDRALGRLISDESKRLQDATEGLDALRDLVPALMAEHLASQAASPRGEPVTAEVVEGGDVVGMIQSLAATSSGEMLWLRPDQWRFGVGRRVDDWVVDTVRAGRRSRAIYPARVLEEAPHVVRSRAEAGEHVRILAQVPSRVAVLGSAAAVLPEQWGVNSGRRLVVRQEAIVSALTTLFDTLWERAMPVPGLDDPTGDEEQSGHRRLLLDQLAEGAKDEQIARVLGMSLRTVRRRVASIMDDLGVESRFQAGVEAVRRGWL